VPRQDASSPSCFPAAPQDSTIGDRFAGKYWCRYRTVPLFANAFRLRDFYWSAASERQFCPWSLSWFLPQRSSTSSGHLSAHRHPTRASRLSAQLSQAPKTHPSMQAKQLAGDGQAFAKPTYITAASTTFARSYGVQDSTLTQ